MLKQVSPLYTGLWDPSTVEVQSGLSVSFLMDRSQQTQGYLEYFCLRKREMDSLILFDGESKPFLWVLVDFELGLTDGSSQGSSELPTSPYTTPQVQGLQFLISGSLNEVLMKNSGNAESPLVFVNWRPSPNPVMFYQPLINGSLFFFNLSHPFHVFLSYQRINRFPLIHLYFIYFHNMDFIYNTVSSQASVNRFENHT